ncbi:argininosuccinate lyase [Brevibacillus laterosporus]|uniref:Argininosuccinate lyase n=1 Tax=Brevibacillus halotolerans TaxID=1507437 RepID=A0ABT4HYG0_9BACL|nr:MULTISPECIES: argininosuccinate lyase [Brevibacillus]MCR8985685.1 argininosuccinate lyase [Brevibacillus laterosporus]MCZ0831419.1 argininosuccinate lyase [Brevibacillus halotolerans]
MKFQARQARMYNQEGTSFPGKTYAKVVLEPAYEEAKAHLLAPMMAINKAHLIMLKEQGLLSMKEGRQIADALQKLDVDTLRQSGYIGEYEDLFFQVENQLLELAGDIAGNLHLARSRNDMGICMYRMVLREKLLATYSTGVLLHEYLLQVAEEHIDTIMLGYTHTQQAQPTTLAHYVMAMADSLERDLRRLRSAYENCNRSPMGAAALTTSGFTISRAHMQELLGFDEIVENSYDAISGADYLGEAMLAVQLAAINLGRSVQDFLLWCTQEFNAVRVADPYVQVSSIMPQKRNPVSLEHMRSLLSSCVGTTNTVLSMMHNTPFGDIVDTEDDMQPYVWKSLSILDNMYHLLIAVITTMQINKEVLSARVKGSFATVTELADALVRTDKLSFRTSHRIVSYVVQQAIKQKITADQVTLHMVNEAAQHVINREVVLTEAELAEALDPVHFVTIRSLPGGPSPKEMMRMIETRKTTQELMHNWWQTAALRCQTALSQLDEILTTWSDNT